VASSHTLTGRNLLHEKNVCYGDISILTEKVRSAWENLQFVLFVEMNIENIYDPGNDDTLVVQSIAHPNSRVTLFLRIRTFFRFIGAELSGGKWCLPWLLPPLPWYPYLYDSPLFRKVGYIEVPSSHTLTRRNLLTEKNVCYKDISILSEEVPSAWENLQFFLRGTYWCFVLGNDDTFIHQSIAHPNSRVTLFLRILTFFDLLKLGDRDCFIWKLYLSFWWYIVTFLRTGGTVRRICWCRRCLPSLME